MMIRRLIILIAISFAAVSSASINTAEMFPQEHVMFLVPYSQGGATDSCGRALAKGFTERGWSTSISNVQGGVAGSLCYETLWNADHDGYNIGVFNETNLFIPAFTGTNITAKDWDYYIAAGSPTVLCVNNYSDIENMNDFMDAWNDGNISLSSPSGGIFLLYAKLFEYSTGNHMDVLTYDGMTNAINACRAGETYAVVASTSSVAEHVISGELIPIAVMSEISYNNVDFGTVQPITEYISDMSEFMQMKQFFGLMIPADTPEAVRNQIKKDFIEVCQSKDVCDFFSANYMDIFSLTGDEAKELCIVNQKIYVKMLYDLGITEYSPSDLNLE